jgi:1,4-alpha-glucan branching enzyme
MRLHPGAGVWEIFIPDVPEGAVYKFEVRTSEGHLRIKTDPYSFRTELRPATASVVERLGKHKWRDSAWMAKRRSVNWLEEPISIYEVHLGSWRRVPEEGNRFLTYRELAHELAEYVTWLGFTHVELLPVMEHPHDPSWGYQVTGYYAPTSRFGSPEEFAYFVDYLHQHNIGVILDWVPAHFPKDDSALRWFDGTALYEHLDPRQGEHPDWGTLVFNYGRPEVHNFLLANALFWCDQFHVDGLRVDAVASMLYLDYSRKPGEWIPNKFGGRENLEAIEFLQHLNHVVHDLYPGVLMIAEESTSWQGVTRPTYLGGLGFTLKWNMGWMNDFLHYIGKDPIYRRYHHHLLTFSLLYAFSENFVLPLSHDEVVHGKRSLLEKMPGDDWQRFANLRLALGYMFGHPGKKLLFMGGEFGQRREWTEQQSLDWHLTHEEAHRQMMHFVRDLNHLYTAESAFYELDFSWNGFEWIDFQDSDASVISFLRRGKKAEDNLVFVYNFTPVPREGYRLGVPGEGFYREVLNSDSQYYGGSNIGNAGGVWAEPIPWHGRSHSIQIVLPPLAVLIFKQVRSPAG